MENKLTKIGIEGGAENALAIESGLEEKDALIAFASNPSIQYLQKISKKKQTEEMVRLAVYNDENYIATYGKYPNYKILYYISKKLLSYDVCLYAVKKDGRNLMYVPSNIITEEMCDCAVSSFGMAIKHVPRQFINDVIIKKAVSEDGLVLGELEEENKTIEVCEFAVKQNGSALKYVPTHLLSKELIEHAVRSSTLDERLRWTIELVPEEYMSSELAELSVALFPHSIQSINPKHLSRETILKYKQRQSLINAAIEERRNEEKEKVIITKKPRIVEMPEEESSMNYPAASSRVVYDLTTDLEERSKGYYYITDIHLERQLGLYQQPVWYIEDEIKNRIDRMLKDIPREGGILLVGGDVADSPEIAEIFFNYLRLKWVGRIVYVLGNHELWDEVQMASGYDRSIDEIIQDYRDRCHLIDILENELLVFYKGTKYKRISEASIINANDYELREVCNNSSTIILGGIGFSALNPIYNSSFGLYGSKISDEEDAIRTTRFRAVYDKLQRCAGDSRVIVLSHTEKDDWSKENYNPNWIYVNGHTHKNKLIIDKDNAVVFSDNQIGYKPRKWSLKGFRIDQPIYDPFAEYGDGIYEVTVKQYLDFNRGRGITVEGCSVEQISMLKKDGVYMFVTRGKNGLQMLVGGRPRNLTYDIDYYYENLSTYNNLVTNLFKPYQDFLEQVSKEVQLFGGSGYIHGCIVDIDFFNHIYLNPFDGKITPYSAEDMENKTVYDSVEMLLLQSPLLWHKDLLNNYKKIVKQSLLPILSPEQEEHKGIRVPEVVLDKTMYGPSRIMKSIQYAIDKKVIRIWNDSILENENKTLVRNEMLLSSK